jgi:hypothetical protein
MPPYKFLIVLLTLPLGWALTGPRAGAQEQVETNQAQAEAPKPALGTNQPNAMAFTNRAMPLPNARAHYNRKEQRLRTHHRSTPIGGLPPGAQEMPPPPLEAASSVSTALVPEANSTVTLTVNRALTDTETHKFTSTVCEPSVAARGPEVLLTGNWFAGFSTNGGASFQYINPSNTFPAPASRPFCCDQVALYDKSHDLMVWLMQHVNDSDGNMLRVAVAHGTDIQNQNWHYYDFSPQSVGNWPKEWFDFPDLSLSNGYLYVSSNVFSTIPDPTTGQEPFKRSALLRLPLDRLAAYQGFGFRYYTTQEFGGLRATHVATDTMYFGTHLNLAKLRLFTWPESSTSVQWADVDVQPWSNQTRVAPGPDGRDWLGRADGRMTAAWLSGNTVGFAWTAAQDSNFAFPQVRVVLVDKNTKKATSQPHIWNKTFAFAYPAAVLNADGRLGISLCYGGGTVYPSHAVGTLRPNGTWDLVLTAGGKFGPNDNRWGDYLAIRPHGADPKSWVATGYTLQTGPIRTDVEVRYINFHP